MTDRHQLYEEFQQKFPIKKLSEMSLEEYTNLDRQDSFCYWLESKTCELGSIWGGSSYKFGIYRFKEMPKGTSSQFAKDEEYAWMSKLGSTREEAFATVRQAIVKTATVARSGKWDDIIGIKNLGAVVKWKIAFLYSEEKLLPIYKKDFLMTISEHLGLKKAEKASRVELYRFLIEKKGLAFESLYDYTDSLLKIREDIEASKSKRLWLCAPGEGALLWQDCLQDGNIRIGWDEITDLTEYGSREELVADLQASYGKPDKSFSNDSLALWQFCNEMKPGDMIIAKKGLSRILGRGIVEGEYYFDENLPTYRHVRKVKWQLPVGEWEVKGLPMKTLTDVTDYKDFIEDVNVAMQDVSLQKESETSVIKDDEQRYWWLVAAPKVWKFSDMPVGEVEKYTLVNKEGHKRHIYQNFIDARKGDKVIGYSSNPLKTISCLGEIAQDTDGTYLYFRKTEQLLNPVNLPIFKHLEALENMEFFKGNGQGSFFKLSQDEYDTIMEIIRAENPVEEPEAIEPYFDADFLNEVYLNDEELHKLKGLITEKKNIILQGAPGVGKTFTAKRLAYALMGQKDNRRIEMVQFHQNYTYEDFVLGYKPNDEGGFELKDGVFYTFCQKALNNQDKEFFFIIDEINRGNLSKIFGELLMLIEKDYRGTEMKLAYGDKTIIVPENLYIIGMMNTADRSLAMIDYALRRRFGFFKMTPGFDTEGFAKYHKGLGSEIFDNVIEGIKALNEVIEKDDSLGSGFCIGHSYFCGQDKFSQDWLENVIDYDIEPMLEEYWFDDPQKSRSQIAKIKGLLK